jgi:hypothetical protein
MGGVPKTRVGLSQHELLAGRRVVCMVRYWFGRLTACEPLEKLAHLVKGKRAAVANRDEGASLCGGAHTHGRAAATLNLTINEGPNSAGAVVAGPSGQGSAAARQRCDWVAPRQLGPARLARPVGAGPKPRRQMQGT